jgi:predicted RNase H-like HicB family nuclease
MLTAYIHTAMRKARCEILPNGEGYFGRIEELQGIWANAHALEACREELQEVLEEWIVPGLRKGHHLSEIDGYSLKGVHHELQNRASAFRWQANSPRRAMPIRPGYAAPRHRSTELFP